MTKYVLTTKMAEQYQQVRNRISGHLYIASSSARSSNTSLHFPTVDEPNHAKQNNAFLDNHISH